MKRLTRREILKVFGISAVAGVVGIENISSQETVEKTHTPKCVLTPQQTAGPFYFDVEQVREDITEGKKGTPLELVITVVDSSDCKPVKDAIVDIWQADAKGVYSGYKNQGVDTTGQTYLRGIQVTDAEGSAKFKTIYPGIYPGRVPHIHFKVLIDNKSFVTSQFYFPAELSKQIYGSDPTYPESKLINESSDVVVRYYGGTDELKMDVKKVNDKYVASHTVGIKI